MGSRPLLSLGIEELERLFTSSRDKSDSLERLLAELDHRSTDRAKKLKKQVQQSLGRLAESVEAHASRDSRIDSDAIVLEGHPARRTLEESNVERESVMSEPPGSVQAGSAGNEAESLNEERATEPSSNSKVAGASELIDLIDYVRHVVQFAEKPVFAIREYGNLCYHENELKDRVGIQHDITDHDGGTWLKVDRLKRNDPPDVPEPIRHWIAVARDPSKQPQVHGVRTETLLLEEAEQLIEKGLVDPADVQPAMKAGTEFRDVIHRLDKRDDVQHQIKAYIDGAWAKWSADEVPRRETIAIYDALFSIQQTLETQSTDQALEVVWGAGIARWKVKYTRIDHPLVEQLVEMDIDQTSGAITVRPRSSEPSVALKPFLALEIDGAETVLKSARSFLESRLSDEEFSPFIRATFEPILRQAVTHLDPQGAYHPDQVSDIGDRSLPEVGERLTITDTWVLYVRRRSDNFFISDLERLKAAVAQSGELPSPSRRFVSEPSDEKPYSTPGFNLGDGFHTGIGGSTGGGSVSHPESVEDSKPEDFFFPKPFNDEQVSIIQRLAGADGVVVQGPPGTGKTHTIGNIICHYLATGKRVLVTSKGDSALSVLRDHIPEGIRDLVICLLTSERDGLKQLEKAVGLLANAATQLNPRQLERDIVAKQEQIVDLQRRIQSIEQEIQQWAEKHLKRIGGSQDWKGMLPIEAAKKVVAEREHHSWFADTLPAAAKPLFSDEDIAALRTARKDLDRDLAYVGATFPSLSDLPDAASIAAIHRDLVAAKQLEERTRDGSIPLLSLSAPDAVERAARLAESLGRVAKLHEVLDHNAWLRPIFERWRDQGIDVDSLAPITHLIPLMEKISDCRKQVLIDAVQAPDGAEKDVDVTAAVASVISGGRPFGLWSFGKRAAKESFQCITVAGNIPSSVEDWKKVADYLQSREQVTRFVSRWTTLQTEFELPALLDNGGETTRRIVDLLALIKETRRVAIHAGDTRTEITALFPYGIDADLVLRSADEARRALQTVQLNLSQQRLASSRRRIEQLLARLRTQSGEISVQLSTFLTQELGSPAVGLEHISDTWQQLCRRVDELNQLRPSIECVERVAQLISESGAARWAQAVTAEVVTGTDDSLTPSNWRATWEWARLAGYLKSIDGRDRLRSLSKELVEHDRQLKRAFARVVELRTYLGLKRNITNQVAAALTMFTTAIRNIGKGTGVRARRFRRDARSAMERSYSAIPCWVMPTWRVSESLPADLGSFDLVIVDEASQSDITALPALVRGKKLLIVGDDKQVSPTAPFVEERKIVQLRHNYLSNQPFQALMLPGGSLYSLAQAVFPSDRILLREHFRCVEPIIRFSFQFYTEPLIPLRLPKASERLDPPLIDVYVMNGHKSRDINKPEAKAIVDEIESLVRDPAYANRTIGVVSLIGGKQAQYIQSLLLDRIGEEVYLRHDIACGDSATFQGKERDIMFISMVACPQTKSAQTALQFQQRFNVALSRARDRQYLFRSVTQEMLNPEDIKAKVISHFKAPMGAGLSGDTDLVDCCDSDFERDVLSRLLKLGYCVTPQVAVAGYRIDLVVEGAEDQRLAIELDGDQYHTPDRWVDDLARQRVLERVGWKFWRCWGSSFTMDPEGCMDDLVATLTDMGIGPLAGDIMPNIYTEHRVLGGGRETREVDEEEKATQLELVSEPDETPSHELSPSARAPEVHEDLTVQAGDHVLISYNDEPTRQYTLLLAPVAHDPDNLVINVNKPLAQALIGHAEEEEVEIPAGGGSRIVTIMKIGREVSRSTVA